MSCAIWAAASATSSSLHANSQSLAKLIMLMSSSASSSLWSDQSSGTSSSSSDGGWLVTSPSSQILKCSGSQKTGIASSSCSTSYTAASMYSSRASSSKSHTKAWAVDSSSSERASALSTSSSQGLEASGSSGRQSSGMPVSLRQSKGHGGASADSSMFSVRTSAWHRRGLTFGTLPKLRLLSRDWLRAPRRIEDVLAPRRSRQADPPDGTWIMHCESILWPEAYGDRVPGWRSPAAVLAAARHSSGPRLPPAH
mmetsp:Transcript_39809/g.78723  ORF Transcript_39809/g.78723 Transcript_39809/m.78723 type:complete len:254 (-) Transcript_39809:120-881(-)